LGESAPGDEDGFVSTSRISGRPFAAIVAAVASAIALATLLPASAAIPQTGAPAPAFSVPALANATGTISLAQYKGKGVYLNFFASWCQPCKAEVPDIARLSKIYARKGVVVIGIDELESATAASGFVNQFKLPYPIGLDTSGTVGGSYGLIGMPLHVFISANGTLLERRAGEMSANQIQAGLDLIARH
jgi:thiol-disulfide isomerase/thioredoxin